ncbi:MAG TPA: isoprenylcysteine carboxylmethyltransferase family protein [Solirubrobacteraceae bacterium]
MRQPLVFHDAVAAILFFGSAILVNGIEIAVRPRSGSSSDSSSGRDWTLLSIYVLTLAAMVGSVVAAELHVAPLGGNPWMWVGVGVGLLWAGFAFRMWAIVTLGRFFQVTVVVQEGHRVVESGPYRWVRHPSYLGAIVSLIGVGVAEGDWASIAIMFVGGLTAFLIRIHVEERVLLAKLGDDYAAFSKRRARLVPGLY